MSELTNPRKPAIKLTGDQYFRLRTWMDQNQPELQRLTQKEITTKAVDELGFPISKSSVAGMIDDLGWQPVKPADPPCPFAAIAELAARVAVLEAAIATQATLALDV